MKGLKPVARRRDDALARVGWDQLETLLASWYRSEGYQVEHVGTGAGTARFDGGIDLKLRRGEQFIVVQCKHWNAMKVPHNAVHELLGLMVNHGATGAILATSGEFTKAAIEAAQKLGHVQLIDGDELRVMLGPIREPAAAFETVRMGTAEGVPGAIARRVGERLLSAAEDRIRYGSGARRQRGTATRSLAALLALKLVALMLFLALALVAWQFLARTMQTALTPMPSAVVAVPASTTLPATTSVSDFPQPHDESCREIIDAKSGSYIDRCFQPAAQRPSAASTGEQQRRAEEALQVIAESTPEL